jgi:hypothetical protein
MLGLAYIVSEIEEFQESYPEQSERAREMLLLYTWWKKDYLTRKDPFDIYFLPDSDDDDDISFTLSDEKKEIYAKISELEKARDEEDTEMLIRLIKLRRSIWT